MTCPDAPEKKPCKNHYGARKTCLPCHMNIDLGPQQQKEEQFREHPELFELLGNTMGNRFCFFKEGVVDPFLAIPLLFQ